MQVKPLSPAELNRLNSAMSAPVMLQADRDWINARIRAISGALRKTLKILQEKEIDIETAND